MSWNVVKLICRDLSKNVVICCFLLLFVVKCDLLWKKFSKKAKIQKKSLIASFGVPSPLSVSYWPLYPPGLFDQFLDPKCSKQLQNCWKIILTSVFTTCQHLAPLMVCKWIFLLIRSFLLYFPLFEWALSAHFRKSWCKSWILVILLGLVIFVLVGPKYIIKGVGGGSRVRKKYFL